MMIWLPYEDFEQNAQALDDRTLSIQRFDVWRAANAIERRAPAHILTAPVTQMWDGHLPWLISYGNALSSEWSRRTGRTSQLADLLQAATSRLPLDEVDYPVWLGNAVLHLSHRSNMIRLNPDHYLKLWPGVPEGIPMVWPMKEENS